ncbi:uncharacterized protein LOC110248941 isoform X3 [Exaiptasia diaphana]|uniref:DOMON domain-containing protein n=1 Tax=Exaiptasia diaphana TaxID=2652724 RepID=A0A913XWX6_EXADI|nr:uncharacterized protein LOC110248941 isoform X3 [Exaiptasia diaphana]
MIVPFVWCILIAGVGFNICKAGNIKLNDDLKLSWRINSTKGTIRFTVTAKISDKGWFMIGFAPQINSSKKVSFEDISGDAFVVWKGASKGKRPIWRLTRGQMVVFGSQGNDDGSKKRKWEKKMKSLNSVNAVQDAFTAVEHVRFFKKIPNSKENKQNDKNALNYAAAIAEKHWIGIILGISAFLTVLITCSVYCFSKKKKNEFKRVVSMPLHKNSDCDDEARVAFLQSEET